MFKGFSNKNSFLGFNQNIFGSNRNETYGLSETRFHWRAESFLGVLNDMDPISTWTDEVLNVSFLQATAANQPRFFESNPAYNGNPTVQFYDANRFMETAADQTVNNRFTMACIANTDTLTQTIYFVLGSSGGNPQLLLGGAFGGINGIYFGGGTQILNGKTESTSPRIVIATNRNLMVDGVLEDSAKNLPPFIFRQLGRRGGNSGWILNGNIAEIIFWDQEASIQQMKDLSDSINSKYAVY